MPASASFLIRHFGPGCLAGISLIDWVALLAENGFRISPRYLGKFASLSFSSAATSIFKVVESQLIRHSPSTVSTPPVFILGSWRSGTTHLHNLLCLDERFISPTLFQTMYPHTCLVSEWWLRPLLELLTPSRRFMDNMKMGLREPAEDEMALAILSRRSNMLSWTFWKNAERYDRYLDFEGVPLEEVAIWKSKLDEFVRKFAGRSGRRPLLKSPNHTARLRILLELYPEARFIHIRRNPYDVYRSFSHMARQVIPVWALQSHSDDEIPAMVIETYGRLYDAYFAQCPSIPENQLFEMSYEELIADPIPLLGKAYDVLQLGGFDNVRPRLERYLGDAANYERNRHADIPAAVLQQLHRRWRRSFEEWHYPMRTTFPIEAGTAP